MRHVNDISDKNICTNIANEKFLLLFLFFVFLCLRLQLLLVFRLASFVRKLILAHQSRVFFTYLKRIALLN